MTTIVNPFLSSIFVLIILWCKPSLEVEECALWKRHCSIDISWLGGCQSWEGWVVVNRDCNKDDRRGTVNVPSSNLGYDYYECRCTEKTIDPRLVAELAKQLEEQRKLNEKLTAQLRRDEEAAAQKRREEESAVQKRREEESAAQKGREEEAAAQSRREEEPLRENKEIKQVAEKQSQQTVGASKAVLGSIRADLLIFLPLFLPSLNHLIA